MDSSAPMNPPETVEAVVRDEKKEETSSSSRKITNFFPVLKTEGRAKMCSSTSGDSKQKEILQKLISTPKENKSQETASTSSQAKTSHSKLSTGIPRGGIKVSSALKRSLSQVLRKSIEASENKKDEKCTEPEKPKEEASEKKTLSSDSENYRKAKKSFPSSASVKKSTTSTKTTTEKIITDEKKLESNLKVKKSGNSSDLSKSTPNSKLLESSPKLTADDPSAILTSSDSPCKTPSLTDDVGATPSKGSSKSKRGKKRHFRGGTYGLYLSKKRKKKNKCSPDSASKDDECSLAGTENSSCIDSEDGNSTVSEDFNTPSEKSIADDEPSLDSRNSPMLSFDSKNSSMETKLASGSQTEKNVTDFELKHDSKQTDSNPNSFSEMEWNQVIVDELSSLKDDHSKGINVPQYDDISNESFSNSNGFLFNKDLQTGNIEDIEIQNSASFDDYSMVDKTDADVSECDFSANLPQKDSEKEDLNQEVSMLLDDLSSSVSEQKNDIEMNSSQNLSSTKNSEDVSVEEKSVSDVAIHLDSSDNLSNAVASSPIDSKNFVENNGNGYNNDKCEENDQLSTIATSVKSRQRIKRRFTDDVVDTEVGLLSVNSMLSSRKPPPKLDPLHPPSDILESFVPAANREAKMGPIAKLECIFNARQPLVDSCTCQEDTYKAKLGKDKQTVYCQAVDSIDDKLVGCCNPVVTSKLVRPSVKIPFTVMCEMHLWRLSHHHSCPYCGLFCSQGTFIRCLKNDKKVIHLFHEQCQVKEEGQVPFCLHCGDRSSLKTIELEMNMISPPTFYLSQQPNDPVAKARISFSSSLSNKDKKIDLTSDKVHKIAESGKVLSSIGLPSGPKQDELDELIKTLNSNKPGASYSSEDFYQAAVNGDVPKMLDMLALGFDPNQKYVDHECNTPLHAAALGNHLMIIHLLIQAGSINDSLNEKIYTPLMIATEKNYEDIVHYLVRKGSLTDFRGENGMTSIHISAKMGNLNLLKILMGSRKIDVNAQDDGGWTAIVWASEHEHYDVVKHLLERGANPNIKDNEGNTGLHWSSFSGSSEICFLYLDYGCEIDAVNEHGDTPLHIAARQDKLACVTLFLSRGANVQIKNKANMLPAECCIDKNSQTYLQLSLNLLLKKITGKYQHKAEKILHRDISRGKELIAIQCVNAIDEEPPPFNFLYVTENCETMPINIDRTITSLQSCHCEDDCTTTNCTCAQISFKCWYDKEGCLLPEFNMLDPPMLFECNRACSCWSLNCRNRILQNGITSRLQLLRTKGKGWGVRTLKDIPKGAFICEYVGELISDSEADKREDDSYLFDLDNRDGDTYCLDARYYGNISRFINHLCEPNLVPVKIFVDHQDLSFPRIAFFSSREIKQYEELGFDYGEKFWAIKYKWFTCDCGTPKCKYSKDTIHETLANYYRRLKEEQMEETAHVQSTEFVRS